MIGEGRTISSALPSPSYRLQVVKIDKLTHRNGDRSFQLVAIQVPSYIGSECLLRGEGSGLIVGCGRSPIKNPLPCRPNVTYNSSRVTSWLIESGMSPVNWNADSSKELVEFKRSRIGRGEEQHIP